MAEQTTHFHLSLREAADIFNPLSTNDNFTTIDAKLYELETKGGIIGYTGTVSANLLTLSGTPTENDTVFKVTPDGDCNTVSFSGAVRQIQAPNGTQVMLKANTLYICYMSSSAMVAIAWPDTVDATSFDGHAPSYYATASEIASVKETAENATQVAQAATTIANNALSAAGVTMDRLYFKAATESMPSGSYSLDKDYSEYKELVIVCRTSINVSSMVYFTIPVAFIPTVAIDGAILQSVPTAASGSIAGAMQIFARTIYFPSTTSFTITVDAVSTSGGTWTNGGGGNLIVNAIYGVK